MEMNLIQSTDHGRPWRRSQLTATGWCEPR
jgi:hypothetical protein